MRPVRTVPSGHDDRLSPADAAPSLSARGVLNGGVSVVAAAVGAAAAAAFRLVVVLEMGLTRIGRFKLMGVVLVVRAERVVSAEARCRHRRQIIFSVTVPAGDVRKGTAGIFAQELRRAIEWFWRFNVVTLKWF